MIPRLLFLICLAAFSLRAQNGDKAGETQARRIPFDQIPPAPVLSPQEAMRSFKLPPGFHVELVAAEPLVEAPVAAQFDPDGKLYVLEMRAFMNNPDGRGEDQSTGRVSVLEDTDGDGRMDKRTTFIDGLVMPRAMALVRGGLLIGEPPQLWFYRDTDGDGHADEKVSVASDYGDRKNPEHTANGLVLDLDNWIYNLYHTYRYRWMNGKWERQPIPNRVQWGMSQDDFGRLYFTQNSDLLRGDLYPSFYAGGRASTAKIPFLNTMVATNQAVFPGRITPGVNRGYQTQVLRDDGRLADFTAACGTVIYRGENFPDECRNDAFVCEPSANLIRRQHLIDRSGSVTSTNAYGEQEFLTSTDERFRPVNLINGPDGALYVIDFARGIIQHRIYMTSYLRSQVEHRGLDKPLDLGRIYRIVHKGRPLTKAPRLNQASLDDLVKQLEHPNGWWRDTAQRLLVDRGDVSRVPELERLAATAADLRTRIHALWTLDGLGKVSAPVVSQALRDPDAKVRLAGLRLAEPLLLSASAGTNSALRKQAVKLLGNGTTEVRVQAALTLGLLAWDPEVRLALQETYASSGSEFVRQAAALGLGLLDPSLASMTSTHRPKLPPEELKRYDAGKEMFAIACAACHQPHGLGQEGLAPPLAGSEWVAGSPARIVRVVLHGLRGPLTVKGQNYQLEMPPLGVLDDEQIANVITYIRHEWGHSFQSIDGAFVKQIRSSLSTREDAWTAPELLRVP